MRNQTGLHQARLAAAGRAVQHAGREPDFGIVRFDPRLPKANALRKTVAVARAGEQIEKETCVVRIKQAQSFGNDLQRLSIGDLLRRVRGEVPLDRDVPALWELDR